MKTLWWGGWGSNPRLADYESSTPATRLIGVTWTDMVRRDHGCPDLGTYLA